MIWNILITLRPNLLVTVYTNTLYINKWMLWLCTAHNGLKQTKCFKSNFNPVHDFLHFKSFCLVVLKLILASKFSELEQFENLAANGLFTNKIAFYGKWLCTRAKCKKGDPIQNSILLPRQHQLTLSTFSKSY